MKILLTNQALGRREGTESYLETIAEELRRLEHEVAFFSPNPGELAAALAGRGYDVYESPQDVPTDIDVIHGQHVTAVGPVRERMPTTPLVFACHSSFIPVEDPVGAFDAAAFIAYNDMTLARLRAHAATSGKPVHRLRQPIHLSFADGHRPPVSETARRAVAVSRRMTSIATSLASSFRARGIELVRVGAPGGESADARQEMLASDIVLGVGRTALEGMALGRATIVLDQASIGGWVTADSYPGLEADGFTGLQAWSASSIDQILDGYDPALGVEARRLAVRHHSAQRHAAQLIEIYSAIVDTPARASVSRQVALLMGERMYWEERALRAEATLARQLSQRIRRFPPVRAAAWCRRRLRGLLGASR